MTATKQSRKAAPPGIALAAVSALTVLAALTATGCSGPQDQGRVVTTEQVQARQAADRTRLANDPNLSGTNRAAMLKARDAAIQRAATEVHAPPPPGH